MVQTGTLKIGDIMVAGSHHGRVKAMFDDTGKRVNEAGPSTPVQIRTWMERHKPVKNFR
jgi:translation initiation factor IF-2